MAKLNFLSEMRQALITAGLVRHPRTAGTLPPCWVDVEEGVPAPGEGTNATEIGQNVVVSLEWDGGRPTGEYNGHLRNIDVMVIMRCKSSARNKVNELALELESLLNDKRNYMLGDLKISESLLYLPKEKIGSSKEQGQTYIMTFTFYARGSDF